MKTLSFKREYIPLLLSGEKRSTVRRLYRKYRVGEEVLLTAGKGDFKAIARIRRIVVKKLGDLSEEDISKEGVKDKESLVKTLKKYYRNRVDEGTRIQILYFDILKYLHGEG